MINYRSKVSWRVELNNSDEEGYQVRSEHLIGAHLSVAVERAEADLRWWTALIEEGRLDGVEIVRADRHEHAFASQILVKLLLLER